MKYLRGSILQREKLMFSEVLVCGHSARLRQGLMVEALGRKRTSWHLETKHKEKKVSGTQHALQGCKGVIMPPYTLPTRPSAPPPRALGWHVCSTLTVGQDQLLSFSDLFWLFCRNFVFLLLMCFVVCESLCWCDALMLPHLFSVTCFHYFRSNRLHCKMKLFRLLSLLIA